jgi:cell division transport system permease protein
LVLAVFLATIAGAGLLAVERTLAQWQTASPTILTIQLPPGDTSIADEVRADALLRRLRAEPGIADVELLPKDKVSQLLKPWLGDDVNAASLPLPLILQVELKTDSTTTSETIGQVSKSIAPNAIIDNHREWRERLVHYVRWLRFGIASSLILVIVVTGLTALFLTLSRMAIHHQAITLLHQLGASDRFVVRGMIRQAGISAAISGAIGFGLALVLLVGLTAASRELDETFLPVLRLEATDWLWLVAAPIAFVGFTVLVTVRTAMHRLKRMP